MTPVDQKLHAPRRGWSETQRCMFSVSSDTEGRGAGGVARGPQCPPPGWAVASRKPERPGAGPRPSPLRSGPGPLGGSSLRTWLSQGSRMCPPIHNSSPRSTTPRQRPGAGKLAETGSQGPGAALGSQRPGLGAVTPGRPPVQQVFCWAAWRGPRHELGQWVPAASPVPSSRAPVITPGTLLGCHVAGHRLGAPAAHREASRLDSTLVPAFAGCPRQPLSGSGV